MPEPAFPSREDLEYFDRVSFMPNRNSPIDRWFQVPDGRSVDEIEFLIGQCSDRYDVHDLGLVVDPLAGAGSAAVAAAKCGLSFLGFERDPPRALFALAKCVAIAGVPIDVTTVASALPAIRAVLSGVVEADPFARPSDVIASAVAVAHLASRDLAAVDDRLALITEDLEALNRDLLFDRSKLNSDVVCGDSTNVRLATVPSDLPPAVLITSPPHPRTRATWAPDDSQAAAYARNSLKSFGRWAQDSPSEHESLGPIDGVFRIAQCLPRTDLVILECETPREADAVEAAYAAAGLRAGYVVEEFVTTYLAAPDEPTRGRGGYLVFRPASD